MAEKEISSDNYSLATMVPCPQPTCTFYAEVISRSTEESTDGPVEFIKLRCPNMHYFNMDIGRLDERS